MQDQSCTIHNSIWSIHEISPIWIFYWDEIQNVVWRWRRCREEVIKLCLVSARMDGQMCSRQCSFSFCFQVLWFFKWFFFFHFMYRCEGTIIDINDKDSIRWPSSEWGRLKVPKSLFRTLKSPNLQSHSWDNCLFLFLIMWPSIIPL